jgi:hypothetical protein
MHTCEPISVFFSHIRGKKWYCTLESPQVFSFTHTREGKKWYCTH